MLYTTTCSSPVGSLKLVASDKGLVAVVWPQCSDKRLPFEDDDLTVRDKHPVLVTADQQLNEYFAGTRKSFDVPLDLRGSVFQVRPLSCVRVVNIAPVSQSFIPRILTMQYTVHREQ